MTETKNDVYQIITTRIINDLEKGTIPWRQPWTESGFPRNLITKRPYRGLNIWLLLSLKCERNYFLTFKQIKDIGATLKTGEKACPVIFWSWPEPREGEPEGTKPKPILRYYLVFNIDQCEGIPENMIPGKELMEKENEPIEACSLVVESMPKRPEIKHKENSAFYHPSLDYINMPKLKSFDSSESYYETLFHELVHSTGHKDRLNRKEIVQQASMGGELYSIEELIAEIGACYLSSFSELTLKNFSNNMAYIDGWLAKLKNDKRFIIYASGHAQKAVDYILNVSTESEDQIPQAEETSQS